VWEKTRAEIQSRSNTIARPVGRANTNRVGHQWPFHNRKWRMNQRYWRNESWRKCRADGVHPGDAQNNAAIGKPAEN